MKVRVHTAIQKSENAVNWRAKGRTTVIGALLNGLLLTTALFSFNVDSNTFFAWMTQDLLPKVSKDSVIVMDNASFHKREDILNCIKSAGCIAEFLPSYSPDLNPIEHSWAQHNLFAKNNDVPSTSFLHHLLFIIFL